jgi:4-hydroxy-tetrahydrodipicolinate reductase
MKLAIAGASGRMGRMLVAAVGRDSGLVLTALLEHPAHAAIGSRLGELTIQSDLDALNGCDVLIDFTRPEGTLAHLVACREAGVKMVIGTTGFDPAGIKAIESFSASSAVVYAANMSLGVTLASRLVADAARALGTSTDIEIVETHHRHKVDAPSGTALMLGQAAAAARGQSLDAVAVYDRHGITGARTEGTIGFAALRGGDVIGDHTVTFYLHGERIEITHRSNSRETYAEGAIRAAKWLVDRSPGLYSMSDVLGL